MEKKEISRTDIQKLHTENAQLRNQQFQITLASLTFFGVANGWNITLKEPVKESLITLILLVILCSLFFWSKRLKNLIDVISLYLKIRGWSIWEYHYRKYSSGKKYGQTQTVALIYIILGFGSIAILLIENIVIPLIDNSKYLNTFDILSWFAIFLIWVGYAIVIYVFGIKKSMVNECEVLKKWINVIEENDELLIDPKIKSKFEREICKG